MEPSARYIVRKGRKVEYIVTLAPPHWGRGDVPGFASEAAANAWIASRPPKPAR